MNQQGVNIKISTQAELSALQATESALIKQYIAAQTLGKEYKSLERDLELVQKRMAAVKAMPPPPAPPKIPLAQKLAEATKEAVGEIPVIGAFSRAFNGALPVVGAGLLVIKKGFDLAGEAIHEFARKQTEMAKLDAALANTGNLTDAYRGKLEELAKERSAATGIDHEQYFGAFTTLTKFGADSSNIEQYTHAVENLAGFLNGDMQQAAFFFGKAMQGSTAMLTRYGIHIDNAKSSTEQLADIMRQLEARGGGQLEAVGNTLEGSFAKVKVAWGEMLASLGSAAKNSGIEDFLSTWAEGLQAIAEKMGGVGASKSKNRESYVAGNSGAQSDADDLTALKSELESTLEGLRKQRIKDRDARGLARMNPLNYLPGSTRIKDLDTSISNSEDATVQINNQLANLDAIAANKNVGKGTPEAAAKQREIDDLRRGSEMLGPAGDPEAIETQKKEVEKNRLAREQIELKKSALNLDVKIAEAVAAGNEKEAARLQWIQDYNKQRREAKDAGMNENDAIMFATRMANADSVKGIKDIPFQHAAPLTDRLSQIGGYNSTPTFQSASSMAAIEDATKRTADAVEKANQKPDPTKPVTTQF